MNKEEAASILQEHLGQLRKRSYAELREMVEARMCKTEEAVGRSGTNYQIEIEAFWDNEPEGHIRIQGSIDDGRWSAFHPLTSDFIMAADGSFVGE
jgi:hypothetical protein